MRLCLVNPNTSEATTAAMLAIARATAPSVEIVGVTAPFGSPLIVNEAQLATAADAVEAALRPLAEADLGGVIVAAFGDPGLDRARNLLACPVTGIAEAGMAEAAVGGRSFAVATATPDLVDAISAAAQRYGHGALFRGVWLTADDPAALLVDPERLKAALEQACRRAVAAGAEAVVIGGGPLATAAQAISARLDLPVVEPVPAAVRLAIARAGGYGAWPTQAQPLTPSS